MGGRFAKSHATDLNQPEIIKALEVIGAKCYEVERPVDLLIEFRGIWIVLEVKNKKGGNKLTIDQVEFFKNTSAPAYVVRDPIEAIDAVQRAWRQAISVLAG